MNLLMNGECIRCTLESDHSWVGAARTSRMMPHKDCTALSQHISRTLPVQHFRTAGWLMWT